MEMHHNFQFVKKVKVLAKKGPKQMIRHITNKGLMAKVKLRICSNDILLNGNKVFSKMVNCSFRQGK